MQNKGRQRPAEKVVEREVKKIRWDRLRDGAWRRHPGRKDSYVFITGCRRWNTPVKPSLFLTDKPHNFFYLSLVNRDFFFLFSFFFTKKEGQNNRFVFRDYHQCVTINLPFSHMLRRHQRELKTNIRYIKQTPKGGRLSGAGPPSTQATLHRSSIAKISTLKSPRPSWKPPVESVLSLMSYDSTTRQLRFSCDGKVPWKRPKENKEETQEATESLANAKGTSIDAAAVTVWLKVDAISTWTEEPTTESEGLVLAAPLTGCSLQCIASHRAVTRGG